MRMHHQKTGGNRNAGRNTVSVSVAVLLALVLFIGLFILLPTLVAGLLPKGMNTYLRSLLEGTLRIIIFICLSLIHI